MARGIYVYYRENYEYRRRNYEYCRARENYWRISVVQETVRPVLGASGRENCGARRVLSQENFCHVVFFCEYCKLE